MNNSNIIDWPQTLANVNNDESLARNVLLQLTNELESSLKDKLICLHKKQQYEDLRFQFHYFQGALLYCVLPRVYQKLENCQNILSSENFEKTQLNKAMKLLVTEIDAVLDEVNTQA